MNDLKPPPAFAAVASLRASARLVFWVLLIDLVTSAVAVTGLLSGVEAVPVGQSAAAPTPTWAWLLAGLFNLGVLAVCLHFAWPLLGKEAPPPSALESSLRRMAWMWRAIGAVALLGLLAGVALVVWIFNITI